MSQAQLLILSGLIPNLTNTRGVSQYVFLLNSCLILAYPLAEQNKCFFLFFVFFTRICIIDSQKIEGPLTYQIVATSIWFHIYTASDQGPFMSYTEYFKQEN